jgi:hypothetical protein
VDSEPRSHESGRRLKISSTLQNLLSTLSPDLRVARHKAIKAVEAREAARALPSVSSAGRGPRRTLSGKALALSLAVGALILTTAACGGAQQAYEGAAAAEEQAAADGPDPREAEKVAEVGGAKARAGAAEARARSVARASDAKTGKWGAVAGSEAKTQKEGDDHPRKVTLKVLGARGTSFSGVCFVAGREEAVEGRVPKRYVYELGDGKLECEVRNESGGIQRVKLTREGVHSLQQSDTSGSTVRVTFSGGDTSTSISSISQIVEPSRGSSSNDSR